MKSKLLIVCVCLFIITLQSWAQIRLGVKGGINLSKISFSGESSNLAPENRTGFSVGPVVDAKIPFFGLAWRCRLCIRRVIWIVTLRKQH